MSGIAVTSFGTADHVLTARTDGGRANSHVSSVIYQIRDDGPAIIDGAIYKDAIYKDSTAKMPGATKAKPVVAAAPAQIAAAPAVSQLSGRGANKAMMLLIALLTVALASGGFYAWQQKLHVNDLQAELKIYQDPDRDI